MHPLTEKKCFIFDLDGTVYLTEEVFPAARTFIHHLREHGKRIVFFTNNASHSRAFYIERLTRMGFALREEEVVYTGMVLIDHLLHKKPDARVYLCASEGLREDFQAAGIQNTTCVPADTVVIGMGFGITYQMLNTATKQVLCGAEFYAPNCDTLCPTSGLPDLDSASLVAAIETATGKKATYFGKPERVAADYIARFTGIPLSDSVMVGDRLNTDIAFGNRAGITTLHVLTGGDDAFLAASACGEEHPLYEFDDLAEVDRLLFGTAQTS